MISRRSFLLLSAASVLSGCSRFNIFETTPAISYPGMHEGHLLRDKARLPLPSGEITTDIAILGSGIAGLTAAWKLSKEGFHNFTLINGPEFGGNASGGHFANYRYPRGAHYLPLPSMESIHMREMLSDFGVILDEPMSIKPYYDEACIVHAPDARLYFKGEWQDGLLPSEELGPGEANEHQRFFSHIEALKKAHGNDGRRAFSIPVALSSADTQWVQLDTISLFQWLSQNSYTSPTLHWYLNYICRDEYGAEYDKVSAWAGLHYFASRAGHAKNAEDGAVLTWPHGLHALVEKFSAAIGKRHQGILPWQQPGFVVTVKEQSSGVEVLCARHTLQGMQTFVLKARRAISAMPLLMCSQVIPDIKHYGFDPQTDMPPYAPWIVSNFLMKRFPAEQQGVPLAWDNVVYQGQGLGYVVSTHQDIWVGSPGKTVFTAYQALSGKSPSDVRKWLVKATPRELFDEAAHDLKQAYGFSFGLHVEALDITVRGHAMASPYRGFLSNRGIASLRNVNGKILFSHSDLSGFSVFEEAAWWGYQAALKSLG